jgi:hypothetical protein
MTSSYRCTRCGRNLRLRPHRVDDRGRRWRLDCTPDDNHDHWGAGMGMGYGHSINIVVETIAANPDTPVSELAAADPRFAEAWTVVLECHELTLNINDRLLRGETIQFGPDPRQRRTEAATRWIDEE